WSRAPTTSRSAAPGFQSRASEPVVAPSIASTSHSEKACRRLTKLTGSTSNVTTFGRSGITPSQAKVKWSGAPPFPSPRGEGKGGAGVVRRLPRSGFPQIRTGVRGPDADQLNLQLQRLPCPGVTGVNDHHPVTDFHDTDQAAPALAVQDSHPLADGKGLVFREPPAGQSTYPAGVGQPIGPLGGHGERYVVPWGQADQTQSQSGQARVVDADGQFQRCVATGPGRSHEAVLKAFHIMDLHAVALPNGSHQTVSSCGWGGKRKSRT